MSFFKPKSFRSKIFLAIFLPSLLLLSLLATSIGYVVSQQMRAEYLERYQTLTSVISDTLQQLEQSAEILARAGAQYLSLYYEKNGLPSEEKLEDLRKQLGVSQMCITDETGHGIRDTANPAINRTFSLFQFCPQYQGLTDGTEKEAITPIIPSYPLEESYKLVMLPAPNGHIGIVQAGVQLASIGNILKKSVRSDKNLLGIGIFLPNGKKLGYWEQKKIPSSSPKIPNITITKKVPTKHENCCECITRHLTDKDNTYYYRLVTKISLTPLNTNLHLFYFLLISVLIGGLIVALFSAHALSKYLVKRLKNMEHTVKNIIETHDLSLKISVEGRDEIAKLAEYFNQMTVSLADAHTAELEKAKALEKLAQQVAHDLGSPLMSLNMFMPHLKQAPETTRIIVRGAIIRINDIARDLLDCHKASEQKNVDKLSTELLTPIIESILTEKRIQYQQKKEIQINFNMQQAYYDYFVVVQPAGLKRILSNLINNAVEAIDHAEGNIDITLEKIDHYININITDNGKGIPASILEKLRKEHFTYGKKQGHGIGLAHAFELLDWWNGTLTMDSIEGKGSTFTLSLPSASPPAWFLSNLSLSTSDLVVILDDDISIHHVWKTRLDGLTNILHCYGSDDFINTIEALKNNNTQEKALFLCDYELLGDKKTGFDLINIYNLNKQSILVTNQYEESQLRLRCLAAGIKFLPKNLACYLPIEIIPTETPSQ